MSAFAAHEYKLVSRRECPMPETLTLCDKPTGAAQYWREHVTANPIYNRVATMLHTRTNGRGRKENKLT